MISIGACHLGRVVVENPEKVLQGDKARTGHVVGFGTNAQGETLVTVRWAAPHNPFRGMARHIERDSDVEDRHPSTLDPYLP